jgi:hypothetical protein
VSAGPQLARVRSRASFVVVASALFVLLTDGNLPTPLYGVYQERFGFSSAALTARYHLYLARGLSPTPAGPRREGPEQDLIARCVPMGDALQAIDDGTIVHAFSVVGLLRAARYLGV